MPVCVICSKPLESKPARNRVTCGQVCRNTLYRRRLAARQARVLAERDELRCRAQRAAALLSA